ncbi:MAG: substrate-binding domain-containing protein, partial [Shimia sp.]
MLLHRTVWGAVILLITALNAWAEDVTLRFPDGSFEVSGELLSFDGQNYRVRDAAGTILTIDGRRVTCAGACPAREDYVELVRLSGAAALADVAIPALIEGFAARRGLSWQVFPDPSGSEAAPQRFLFSRDPDTPVALFEVASTPTGDAYGELIDGITDIVLADRPPTRAEVDRAQEAGLGELDAPLRRRLVARRLLRPIVGRDAPLRGVTTTQLQAILTGAVNNWREVGGPDLPITVHIAEGDATQLAAHVSVLARQTGVSGALAEQIVVHDGTGELNDVLSRQQGALVVSPAILFAGRPLPLSHGCVPGSASTEVGLREGANPLSVPLWTWTGGPRLAEIARDFLIFATSPDAQQTLARSDLIDLRPREVQIAEEGTRLFNALTAAGTEVPLRDVQRVVRALGAGVRLSTTFRFTPGTARLAADAKAEVQTLAHFIDAGAYAGKTITFAGFSDSQGDAEANARLSETRAQAVLTEVRNALTR